MVQQFHYNTSPPEVGVLKGNVFQSSVEVSRQRLVPVVISTLTDN
jgi:hypothetical protein